ncbi:hypothetical protein KDU71_07685 [Carboxylicivirga sediminis]|uniref:Uncharacterized protein n=1 Tax=Carboxylicivirga sediminis TaxID=2006564 RepID=A0A941IXC1_9BACT|nr:hypothetical protein [Carboxylicivirga sediminis]MBR8535438.1 hypothetical protein [Carboxylicivirga sediminis]
MIKEFYRWFISLFKPENPLDFIGKPMVWNTRTEKKVKKCAMKCHELTGQQFWIVPVNDDHVVIVNSQARKQTNQLLRQEAKQLRKQGKAVFQVRQISHYQMISMAYFETPKGFAIKQKAS